MGLQRLMDHAYQVTTTSAEPLPHLALTQGDRLGIGAEILAKALSDPELCTQAQFTILGEQGQIASAFRHWGTGAGSKGIPESVQLWDPTLGAVPPEERDLPEQTWIREGALGCLTGRFDALITGPISKASMYARGFRFPGHTEYLAHVTGASHPVMAFTAPQLKVALLTVHEPLARVPELITGPLLLKTLRIIQADLQRWYGLEAPRIAVCGLNPHAGEGGHLGQEERLRIQPVLEQARAEGLDVRGPFPADTVFIKAAQGGFDLVLAMYHDQGLIPVKLLSFGRSVNVTLGLPMIRTSVDHGVAWDIAGKGIAEAQSLKSAIREALQMAIQRATVLRRSSQTAQAGTAQPPWRPTDQPPG